MTEQGNTSKSFMDRVYGFLGIEHEQELEDEVSTQEEAYQSEQPQDNRRSRIVSLTGGRGSGEDQSVSVIVQKPMSFDDVQQVADHLKNRQPVILSVEFVSKEVARRLVDFVSGAAYALDGRMYRLGESLFLFTPSNIGIDVPGVVDEE